MNHFQAGEIHAPNVRMFPTPGRLGESRHAVQRAMLLAGRVKEERHGGHGGQLLGGRVELGIMKSVPDS